MFKCKFLNKIGGLQSKGNKMELMRLIDEWIDENENNIFCCLEKTKLMKNVVS